MKEFLSHAGVPFVVRDIDEDEGAYDEVMARGWRSVPMTSVGDRVIRGFDPVGLRNALAALAVARRGRPAAERTNE